MRPDSAKHHELKQQLKVAVEARKEAVKRFRNVIRDVPSGLPHPDGRDRIQHASREVTKTHNALMAVLTKLNQHSLDGDGHRHKQRR